MLVNIFWCLYLVVTVLMQGIIGFIYRTNTFIGLKYRYNNLFTLTKSNRLLVVDGSSIFSRAYFAVPSAGFERQKDIVTQVFKEFQTDPYLCKDVLCNEKLTSYFLKNADEQIYFNGLYGFIRSIRKNMVDLRPTHTVIVFDGIHGRDYRRNIAYTYKLNRTKRPKDFYAQLPFAVAFSRLAGLYVLHDDKEKYEGDDFVASTVEWAKTCKTINFNSIYILSSDKDFMQLLTRKNDIGPSVFLVQPHKNNRILNGEIMEKEIGILPNQVVDYLALTGDKADNVPGIPGVGPKTAATLLRKYETLDIIQNNISKLNEPIKKSFLLHKHQINTSKQLLRLLDSLSIFPKNIINHINKSDLTLSPYMIKNPTFMYERFLKTYCFLSNLRLPSLARSWYELVKLRTSSHNNISSVYTLNNEPKKETSLAALHPGISFPRNLQPKKFYITRNNFEPTRLYSRNYIPGKNKSHKITENNNILLSTSIIPVAKAFQLLSSPFYFNISKHECSMNVVRTRLSLRAFSGVKDDNYTSLNEIINFEDQIHDLDYTSSVIFPMLTFSLEHLMTLHEADLSQKERLFYQDTLTSSTNTNDYDLTKSRSTADNFKYQRELFRTYNAKSNMCCQNEHDTKFLSELPSCACAIAVFLTPQEHTIKGGLESCLTSIKNTEKIIKNEEMLKKKKTSIFTAPDSLGIFFGSASIETLSHYSKIIYQENSSGFSESGIYVTFHGLTKQPIKISIDKFKNQIKYSKDFSIFAYIKSEDIINNKNNQKELFKILFGQNRLILTDKGKELLHGLSNLGITVGKTEASRLLDLGLFSWLLDPTGLDTTAHSDECYNVEKGNKNKNKVFSRFPFNGTQLSLESFLSFLESNISWNDFPAGKPASPVSSSCTHDITKIACRYLSRYATVKYVLRADTQENKNFLNPFESPEAFSNSLKSVTVDNDYDGLLLHLASSLPRTSDVSGFFKKISGFLKTYFSTGPHKKKKGKKKEKNKEEQQIIDLSTNQQDIKHIIYSYKQLVHEVTINYTFEHTKTNLYIGCLLLSDLLAKPSLVQFKYKVKEFSTSFGSSLKDSQRIHLLKLWNAIESPLIYGLYRLERNGICMCKDTLIKEGSIVPFKPDDVEANVRDLLYKITGKEEYLLKLNNNNNNNNNINLNSPKQLGHLLYIKLGFQEMVDKYILENNNCGLRVNINSGELESTNKKMLKLLKIILKNNENEKKEIIASSLVDSILLYREMSKLYNTYALKLPLHINEHTNRIHSQFSQTGTATGRLACFSPNLQNIPENIRTAFYPNKYNHIENINNSDKTLFNQLISIDFCQMELRLLAFLTHDEKLLEALKNQDPFQFMGNAMECNSHIFSSSQQQRRSIAKTITYGILYGQGAQGLADSLNVTREVAQAWISTFYNTYPNVLKYRNSQHEFVQRWGYCTTLTGRVRFINANFSNTKRIAMNSPIQGLAADVMKYAFNKTLEAIEKDAKFNKNFWCRLILQLHDELLFEVHEDNAQRLINIVKPIMENSFQGLIESTNSFDAYCRTYALYEDSSIKNSKVYTTTDFKKMLAASILPTKVCTGRRWNECT